MRRWPGEGWEGRGSGAGRMEVRELLERMLHCPVGGGLPMQTVALNRLPELCTTARGGAAHADRGVNPTVLHGKS